MAVSQFDTSGDESQMDRDLIDNLTESSENLLLKSLSDIIANSERNVDCLDSELTITEITSQPQPQFGYFVPLKLNSQFSGIRYTIQLFNLSSPFYTKLNFEILLIMILIFASLENFMNQADHQPHCIIFSNLILTVDQSVSAPLHIVIMDVIK